MKDVEYVLKVMNSKVYGLRDAMVRNAKVFNNFTDSVAHDFSIVRKRITRLERREAADRFLIYCLVGRFIYQDYKNGKFTKCVKKEKIERNFSYKIKMNPDGTLSEIPENE